MGGRYKLIFWGALLVALAATFGAYKLLTRGSRGGDVAMRSVVIANRDIPEGASIDRAMLSSVQSPVQTAPVGAYLSIDSVVGRVTRVAVYNGEAIVPGRLAPVGSGPGLELKIPPGQRAMAVRINDVAGISGLLQPNSRVDVLVTIRDDNSATQVAKLFMSNMLVLSVGTDLQRDASGKPISATTVTLAVTPQDAERLAIAMNTGSIQLVLRGYGETDTISTKGATSSDVLSQLHVQRELAPAAMPSSSPRVIFRTAPAPRVDPPVVKAPVRPPDSATVNVFRAGKSESQKFDTAGKR